MTTSLTSGTQRSDRERRRSTEGRIVERRVAAVAGIFLSALWLTASPAGATPQEAQSTPAGEPARPAAQPSVPQRQRTFEEIVMMPVVYSVPGMDAVGVRRDLDYTGRGDERLRMDVYLPSGLAAGERRPAVLFVHGGTSADTRPKDWGIYTSWGRLVAASGLVAVTFTHRLGFPRTQVTEGAADVEAALAYVRANAADLGVDPNRLCLAVFSAGGPLLSPFLSGAPPYVRCLVAFYTFMDIRQSEHHRSSETPETIRAYSPILQISEAGGRRIPPFLLARAGRDEIPTLLDSIDRFVERALAENVPLTLLNHPAGVHGFDNQTDDERSREIVKAALEFLRTHLAAA